MSVAADHIRALVCHFPRHIRSTRLLLMLRAYFDDSRHDRQDGIAGGVYLLAGYLGDTTKWKQFADDWHTALHRGPRPLDFLKTHQAYRLDDPESMFYRWSPQERDSKLLLLAKTVNRHAMLSVQTIVCGIRRNADTDSSARRTAFR